jgi:uncharacterized membrane protein
LAENVAQDDKVLLLLAYPIWIIAGLIIILSDKKKNPFMAFHGYQSIFLGIALMIVGFIVNIFLGITIIFLLLMPLVWLAFWIYQWMLGYKAMQGEYVTVPLITDLTKKFLGSNQG